MGRVAGLADVSVRTLHHYDEIGLVRPSERTAAGYRAYTAGDVERLREVIAYRRLGFGLREIADLVDDPDTDAVAHLRPAARPAAGTARPRRRHGDGHRQGTGGTGHGDQNNAGGATEGVRGPVVRRHRVRLPGHTVHGATDRRAHLGGARGRADRAQRGGGHRLLRAPGPRRDGGGTVGGHAGAAPGGRRSVRGRRRGASPVRGSVLRRRDGGQHRASLAGPGRRAAGDAAGGPPRGRVHVRREWQRLASTLLAHPRLPARIQPACSSTGRH